ncbi:hypothetical protein XBI1_2280014 [Xenorhabdus bovienii str. Intermedium]|uniref:Uncharacterized protein n=1 Tax=Xenorhabdus bovienii str. Intermedium TaxID=1379677 RepID=A0A077QI19_XENBV|nr:hypothetical protein XBI1_2280014 [Xenorhabdus bovienii str. Intermedium]
MLYALGVNAVLVVNNGYTIDEAGEQIGFAIHLYYETEKGRSNIMVT